MAVGSGGGRAFDLHNLSVTVCGDMAWFGDLASELGVPAGAVTIAVATYAASVAAQRAARPSALADVSHLLRLPIPLVQPSAIVEKIFRSTFGDKHFSVKCFVRSVAATSIFVGAIVLALCLERKDYISKFLMEFFNQHTIYLDVLLLGILPDYIALAKTRILIRTNLSLFLLLLVDVISSVSISCLAYFISDIIENGLGITELPAGYGIFSKYNSMLNIEGIHATLLSMISSNYGSGYTEIFFTSTLLTSVWAGFAALSTVVIKIISPLQRVTTWFFDVEERPIEAIGLVAGALIVLGSLIWSLARAAVI
jgi:hypothetical protein